MAVSGTSSLVKGPISIMGGSFIARDPRVEDYWRAIVLFGRNVASYKFALAKTLLALRPQSGTLVKLEDLALPFALNVCEHLKKARQGSFEKSAFLDACRRYNEGELGQDGLAEEAVQRGFTNVIDAFHVVGQAVMPLKFYDDERKGLNGIRILDGLSRIFEGQEGGSLAVEVESRWRLVETAWELGVSRNLLSIGYDDELVELFTVDQGLRRRSVTGGRGALNGYQKGRCFYCSAEIGVSETASLTDVDHFFPHRLKAAGFSPAVIDGVWNLVLACRSCNRGSNGKFDRLPSLALLERIAARNEFLIMSHHPLRETLMAQTGASGEDRRLFLNDAWNRAKAVLIHEWAPKSAGPALI